MKVSEIASNIRYYNAMLTVANKRVDTLLAQLRVAREEVVLMQDLLGEYEEVLRSVEEK